MVSSRPPDWQLPPGVSPGTWDYAHQHSIASQYDAFLAGTPLAANDLAWLLPFLPPAAADGAGYILDLGCGNGRTAIPLRQAGYRVMGVDLSLPMLNGLQAAAGHAGVTIPGIHANLVQLNGFRDAVADHAVCLFSTLGMIRGRHHRLQFLRHVARVVRPPGVFVVHVHNRRAWLLDPGGMRRLLVNWWRSKWTAEEFGDSVYPYRSLADMFLHVFSARELRRDLRQAGWRVTHWLRVSVTGERLLSRRSSEIAGGFFAICQHR